LNYTWASEPTAPDIITSSYTDRSKMIILEKGRRKAGIWVEENVNIIADYRRAFGMNPPEKAMLGIMNDSENMKGSAVSYVTGIVLSR
jgi:chemotaxis signal transduction protein